jgi:hypothetical protein
MESWRLAWVAGFFEGEGCISIKLNRKNIITLECIVGNTDREPLVYLKRLFGGSIRKRRKQKENHKQSWAWVVATRQAAVFLRRIRPYLIRSRVRRRADVAIQFQEQKRPLGQLSVREDYLKRQFAFYECMKRLNQKGE